MDEAEICNKVAIMDAGHIVAMDTPYELKKKYTKDHANITINESDELYTELSDAGFKVERKKGYYSTEVNNINDLLEVLSKYKSQITDLEIKKGTLNDVFLKITGKDIRE